MGNAVASRAHRERRKLGKRGPEKEPAAAGKAAVGKAGLVKAGRWVERKR